MLKRLAISMVVVLVFVGSFAPCASAVEKPGVTNDGQYLASISRVRLEKAYDYVKSNDMPALQKLLDNKTVFLVKGGVRVFVVDSRLSGTRIKVRMAGYTGEFWTIRSAVTLDPP